MKPERKPSEPKKMLSARGA
jgi:hypothetical protein